MELKNTNKLVKIYLFWAIISIVFAVLVSKNYAESLTRILVIIFLIVQLIFKKKFITLFLTYSPKLRFIFIGSFLASIVEGFHMISTPVFSNVRITENTSFIQGINFYLIDLIFTLPAYFIIFYVIWIFINKYKYSLWEYIIIMGFSQALGDGGFFFFLAAPFMLLFLPYPTTNYHAINIIPFLAVKDEITPNNNKSLKEKIFSYSVIPSIIITYFICGAIIKVIGKFFGFE